LAPFLADRLQEFAKLENVDPYKLYQIALQMLQIYARVAHRQDHEYHQKKFEEIRKHVEEIRGTFNSKFAMGLTITSAALSFVGAVLAFLPIIGAKMLIAAATIDAAAKASPAVSALSSGIGQTAKIPEENMNSYRAFWENIKQEAQARQNNAQRSEEQNNNQALQAHRTREEAERARRESTKSMAGGN